MGRKEKFKKTGAVNSKMMIGEIISRYPETMEVFLKYGFHCLGCMGASFENLKQAAKVHGVKLAVLMRDLKNAVRKTKKTMN